jgi:hypothetical protein
MLQNNDVTLNNKFSAVQIPSIKLKFYKSYIHLFILLMKC